MTKSFHTFPEWLAEVQRIAGEEFDDSRDGLAHHLFNQGAMPEEAAKELLRWG